MDAKKPRKATAAKAKRRRQRGEQTVRQKAAAREADRNPCRAILSRLAADPSDPLVQQWAANFLRHSDISVRGVYHADGSCTVTTTIRATGETWTTELRAPKRK